VICAWPGSGLKESTIGQGWFENFPRGHLKRGIKGNRRVATMTNRETGREWFVQDGSPKSLGHIGPLSADELYRHFHNGKIGPTTLLWREGMKEWRQLSRVPEINDSLHFNLKTDSTERPRRTSLSSADRVATKPESRPASKSVSSRAGRPNLLSVDPVAPLPFSSSSHKDFDQETGGNAFEHIEEWKELSKAFQYNPSLAEKVNTTATPSKAIHRDGPGPKESGNDFFDHNRLEERWEVDEEAKPELPKVATNSFGPPQTIVEITEKKEQEEVPFEEHFTRIKKRMRSVALMAVGLAIAVGTFLYTPYFLQDLQYNGRQNETETNATSSNNEKEINLTESISTSFKGNLWKETKTLPDYKLERLEKIWATAPVMTGESGVEEKIKMSLTMDPNGLKVWLAANLLRDYHLSFDFKSVQGKSLGKGQTQFKVDAFMHDGLGFAAVSEFQYALGSRFETGLYQVVTQGRRVDSSAKLYRILQEKIPAVPMIGKGLSGVLLPMAKSLVEKSGPLEFLLPANYYLITAGEEKETAMQIKAYVQGLLDRAKRPLREQVESLRTLATLAISMGSLMQQVNQTVNAKTLVIQKETFIKEYAKKIAPMIQLMAVPDPKVQIVDGTNDNAIEMAILQEFAGEGSKKVQSAIDQLPVNAKEFAETAKKMARASVYYVESFQLKTNGKNPSQLEKELMGQKEKREKHIEEMQTMAKNLQNRASSLEQDLLKIDDMWPGELERQGN